MDHMATTMQSALEASVLSIRLAAEIHPTLTSGHRSLPSTGIFSMIFPAKLDT